MDSPIYCTLPLSSTGFTTDSAERRSDELRSTIDLLVIGLDVDVSAYGDQRVRQRCAPIMRAAEDRNRRTLVLLRATTSSCERR